MNEATFWQMIEQAKAESGGDNDAQVELLTEHLSRLEIDEILEFDFLFRTFHAMADRCDIYEAGGIALGSGSGYGGDGFMDFQAWLIAQGKDVYEQVLSDPDWLAQVVEVIEDEMWGDHADVMLELMNYVAMKAYKLKTGDYENMPRIPAEPLVISGEYSSEEELPHKYPNLWALFGDKEE